MKDEKGTLVKVRLLGDAQIEIYNLALAGEEPVYKRPGDEVEVDSELAAILIENKLAENVK